MGKFGVYIILLIVWKEVIGQNLEFITCRGEGRIMCFCDHEASPLQPEDQLYRANIQKIQTSIAITIENCKTFVFDPSLEKATANLQTLALRNITHLILQSLPNHIKNLYITNVTLKQRFDRKLFLFLNLKFLDNLFLTNVAIDNFANDSFVDTLIYKAQFRNVTFKNVTEGFFENANTAVALRPNSVSDFVLKSCDLYDVSRLNPGHFLNTNFCVYELITHANNTQAKSDALIMKLFTKETYILLVLTLMNLLV